MRWREGVNSGKELASSVSSLTYIMPLNFSLKALYLRFCLVSLRASSRLVVVSKLICNLSYISSIPNNILTMPAYNCNKCLKTRENRTYSNPKIMTKKIQSRAFNINTKQVTIFKYM